MAGTSFPYDVNGFKTEGWNADPGTGTLNNPDTSVLDISGAMDPADSVYSTNQVLFSKTLLINRIFNLLNQMIGVLQKASAAESNRLNYLTEWQKAYTDDMNQIHSFSPNNGDWASNQSSQDYGDMRTDLNQLNSAFTTQLQNLRGVVSDDSKSMQTNVSQLSDAVNQQSSLASSLLQQLGQLTSTIFKSS